MGPYRPVDSTQKEIRLLEIQPSRKQDSPIICELKHAYLTDNPKYECLSYVWGDQKNGTDIQLDGVSFHVFENCAAAIRRLRNRSSPRTVWIDAICINQGDNGEKGGQIGLMSDIYQRAHQVVVWLGELTEGGIVGVKGIQGSMSQGWHMWQVDRRFGKLTLPVRESFGSSMGVQNRASLVQEQGDGEVKEILDRLWFTRVWIMQEAILARRLVVMCGPEEMAWERIGSVAEKAWKYRGQTKAFGMVVDLHHVFPDETYRIICGLREKWSAGGWDVSLYQLLYDYRHLDCTNPRDRIYGFLGLAPASSELGIVPDYGLRPDQIYTGFARTVMEKTLSLDLLHCVRDWQSAHVPFPERPMIAHSLIEQARYHDVHATLTDGPDKPVRKGWARLPPGWERIQEESKPCYYRNHNDGGSRHDTSILEGGEPIPAQHFIYQRYLPKGWIKGWNNLGQSRVEYSPASLNVDHHAERVKYLRENRLDTLPSWVSNWAARTDWDPSPLLDWTDPLPRYWAAGKSSTANTLPNPDPNILSLEGLVFDSISQNAPAWHPSSSLVGPFSRHGIPELEAWEAIAVADHQPCPYTVDNDINERDDSPLQSPKGRANALWRTLIADYAGPDRSAPEADYLLLETWYDRVGWNTSFSNNTSLVPKSLGETASESIGSQLQTDMMEHYINLRSKTAAYVEHVGQASVTRLIRESFDDATKIPKLYGEVVRRVRRACEHRRLFVTRGGYIGLAGWNAREGDLVCLLRGGKTPFVLRGGRDGTCYQLVGEAFVYGIMGGEAIRGTGEGVNWRVFDIR